MAFLLVSFSQKSNFHGQIENTIFGKVTLEDTLGNTRENIYKNSMSINKGKQGAPIKEQS